MVGYVLLISLAVFMGGILFVWMKSYVPQEKIECPEGTSLSIANYVCDSGQNISLTLRNNGRFSVGGYFIYAGNNTNESIASIDLSPGYINNQFPPTKYGNAILFGNSSSSLKENFLGSGDERINIFDLSSAGDISFVEIIPIRWEEIKGKIEFTSCGEESRIKEAVVCT